MQNNPSPYNTMNNSLNFAKQQRGPAQREREINCYSGICGGPKKGLGSAVQAGGMKSLASESVQGAALTFESVDNIHSCDSLALGMLGVGDSVTDNVLKENLEDTAGLLVDETRDTLDSTTAGQTTDGGLGDTLDVITQDFAVPLGSALSESLSSFTTSRHCEKICRI